MVIAPDGTVRINTINTAGFHLAVKGKVRAREVKVESVWADIVFEEEYYLRPLDEVKQFIKAHGHLPEVPSAQVVKENGVDLGEAKALFQKIEELTLHLIELKRENKERKQQNTEILQKLNNV